MLCSIGNERVEDDVREERRSGGGVWWGRVGKERKKRDWSVIEVMREGEGS